MDNEKLAKAIAVLYSVVTPNDNWDDTDEAIQTAAFLLYEKADCAAVDFGVLLYAEGLTTNFIADFCDVSIRSLLWACQERETELQRQAILSPVEVP